MVVVGRISWPPPPYEVGKYDDQQDDPQAEPSGPQQAQSPSISFDVVLQNNNTSLEAFPIVGVFKSFSPMAMSLGEAFLLNKYAGEEIKFVAVLWRRAGRTKEGLRLK